MRIRNSLKNILTVMISNILTIIIGLVAQALFIKILGSEYLGLNSLFTNIISMLGIVELGLGSAIIFHLYEPLAKKNIEKIKSLLKFYRKSYYIIGILVLIIGLTIIPLIPFVVDIDSVIVDINIYVVYILFLFDTVLSYFLSYKRSILYADQKNYIITYIHIFYTLILNITQIIVLYLTKNYYLYLIVKIIMRFLENLIITIIANKKYPYLLEGASQIDKETENDIFTKIKALFFHKIGGFVVLGTDNIIISKYLGLITLGLYSNYYLIINSVQSIFTQALSSITASIGNLLITEDKEKQFDVFKKLRFLNFWIAVFSCTSILVIMESFIKIWIGEEFILSNIILIVLVINLYQKLMRNTYMVFKEAAGICYEDRFVPIVESILNIFFSILLVKRIGLPGVFLGTIISGLALWCYSFPKFVYKKMFDKKYVNYILETLGYLFVFIIILSISNFIANAFIISNLFGNFLKNVIISLLIPNILMILFYYKSDNFKYYIKIINKRLKNYAK